MTKAQKKLKRRWVRYLSDSRLPKSEVLRRAAAFTRKGQRPTA